MSTTAGPSDGFRMAVIVESGITVVALILALVFRIPLREQFAPWGTPLVWAVGRGVLATAPMLMVFGWLVHARQPPMRQLREHVEWLVREMFPAGSVGQFAMIAALAGVGEELLFRGVLQTKLVAWTTPVIGLVGASLLFGLAHALSKLYFTFAVAVGVFLGWLALRYNDLVAPMVAHSLYDLVALVYLARGTDRQLPPVEKQKAG